MRVFQSIIRFVTDAAIALVIFVALFTIVQSPASRIAWQNSIASLQDRFSVIQNLINPAPKVNYGDTSSQSKAVIDRTSSAVVSIYGRERSDSLGGFVITKVTSGTGFFISSDGYLLTNKHVVTDDVNYTVVLSDGQRRSADVVYRDPNNDLAILKIAGSDYPVLSLGDSSGLAVGQPVVGIGNVYGESMTASQGNISGLHRVLYANETNTTEVIRNAIQMTAQLYPGDSGGPLLDMSGNVIGIDVATSVDKSNESFAIPINDAKADINAVIGK